MFSHYIRSFFIHLKKNRFFNALNLLGFAAGFLLLTLISAFVYQETAFDRFHKNADRIYRLHPVGYGVTPACFADKLAGKLPEIRRLVRLSTVDLPIRTKDTRSATIKISYTDPAIFEAFSFPILSGRPENALKSPFSIVVTESLARRLFGDSPPIGQTIQTADTAVLTVTGVMKDLPYVSHIRTQAFVSMETLRLKEENQTFGCGSWSMLTYVELDETADPGSVAAKINELLEAFRMDTGDGKVRLVLEPLADLYFNGEGNRYDGSVHGSRQTVMLYLAVSLLILFIVVINYINLSTALAGNRIRETAIRKVHGASRRQVVIQVMVEAAGMALIAFLGAWILIELLLPQLSGLLNIPLDGGFNRRLLLPACLIGAGVLGAASGLIPGLLLSKTEASSALKDDTPLRSRGGLRKVLLVFQVMIVAGLLNATCLISSQMAYVLNLDLGFRPEQVLSFRMDGALSNKKDLLKRRLAGRPEIGAIAFSDDLIGGGFGQAPIGNEGNKTLCYFLSVDPDYLPLYGIELTRGRNFSWEKPADFADGCLINEAAREAFGLDAPEDKMLDKYRVLGVVSNFNFISLHQAVGPLIIHCSRDGQVAQVRVAAGQEDKAVSLIRQACLGISPDYDFNYTFLQEDLRGHYRAEINLRNSFRFYALIAFLIALLGLFGLTLFVIRKRTREMAIRRLYGANTGQAFRLLTGEQLAIVLTANLLALPVSWWLMDKWLDHFQYRIGVDAAVFVKTLGITLFFNFLAASFLLFRLGRVNLVESLRQL